MIFQDPLSSLHPLLQGRLADRRDDPRARQSVSQGRRPRKRAIDLLGLVGIPQPDRRVDDYPHQFSGGMRQRAMIAMAHGAEPEAADRRRADHRAGRDRAGPGARADEALQEEFGTAIIMITHDLGVDRRHGRRRVVMYAGRGHGAGRPARRSTTQHHPYTEGLLQSMPADGDDAASGCVPIPGQPPSLLNLPPGARSIRAARTSWTAAGPRRRRCAGQRRRDHLSACWLPHDMAPRAQRRRTSSGTRCASRPRPASADDREGEHERPPSTDRPGRGARGRPTTTSCCALENVVKYFPVAARSLFARHEGLVHAVDGRQPARSAAARPSAWSARPAAASPRWPAASPGSTTSPPARSPSTARTSPRCPAARCGRCAARCR